MMLRGESRAIIPVAITNLLGFSKPAAAPASFVAELDRQCRRVSLAGSIIAMIAWIPYIPIDRDLHPGQPSLFYWRIGFSIVGCLGALLHFIPGIRYLGLTVVLIVGIYMEIATAVITALTGGDPAYMGGYCLVLMLIPLGPMQRRVAWGMLVVSLSCFLGIVLDVGWNLKARNVLYAAQNLAVAGFLSGLFIFITDKLRKRSWQRVSETWDNLRRTTRDKNIAETERQRTEQLNSLLKKINERPDIDSVMQVISEYVAQKYRLPYHCLFSSSPEDARLKFAHANLPGFVSTEDRHFFTTLAFEADSRNDENLHARAIRTKLPMYTADIGSQDASPLDKRLYDTLGQKSLVTLPVFLAGKLIATLDFYSNNIVEISAEQISELEILAEHLAGVINSTLLLNQVHEAMREASQAREESENQKREVENMHAVTQEVSENLDLDRILSRVAQYLEQVFRIRHFYLWKRDARRNELYAHSGSLPDSTAPKALKEMANLRIPLTNAGGMHAAACHHRKPVHFKHMLRRKSACTVENQIQALIHFEELLIVPIIANGEVVATLDLSHIGEKLTLEKRDVQSIHRFCTQIGAAINNAALMHETEEAKQFALAESKLADMARAEAEAAHRETRDLNLLIRRLNENPNLDEIAVAVHKHVTESFGITYMAMYGVDKTGDHLRAIYISYPDYVSAEDRESFSKAPIPVKGVRGAHAMAIRARKPWYLRKVKREGVTKEELFAIERLRMQSFLMIPLVLHGEPVGMIDFWNDGPMPLSPTEISRLSILGEQLAGIFYSSRLFGQVQAERERSDRLLRNTLPAPIAEELKTHGQVTPQLLSGVSVLFTDFVGFTRIAESLSPQDLVKELDGCFSQFDEVVRRNNLEKLKTIGDAYMCAAGLPEPNAAHAVDACLTALEFCAFMNQMAEIKKSLGSDFWKIRIGVHSGPVTAGVIGTNKFAYDIWGDTVNTASRMESSGQPGQVNISAATYEHVREFFEAEWRGEVEAKGKGKMGMYFLVRIKPELAMDAEGRIPNRRFVEMRRALTMPEAIPAVAQLRA